MIRNLITGSSKLSFKVLNNVKVHRQLNTSLCLLGKLNLKLNLKFN